MVKCKLILTNSLYSFYQFFVDSIIHINTFKSTENQLNSFGGNLITYLTREKKYVLIVLLLAQWISYMLILEIFNSLRMKIWALNLYFRLFNEILGRI